MEIHQFAQLRCSIKRQSASLKAQARNRQEDEERKNTTREPEISVSDECHDLSNIFFNHKFTPSIRDVASCVCVSITLN